MARVARWLLVFWILVGALPLSAEQRAAEELANFPGVWMMKTPGSGIVTLRLEFDGGSTLDSSNKQGLTALAIQALSSEVKPIPGTGVRLRTGSTFSVLTIQVLAEDLSKTLESVEPLILEPGFSEQTFARVKQQIGSFLRSRSEDHYTYSKEEWLRIFHGVEPVYGTPDSVNQLTYDAALTAAATQLREQNLTASVVGDLTGPDALPALQAFFSALHAPDRASSPGATDKQRSVENLVTLDSQSKETSIVFGAAPENTVHDFFVGTIVAQLFGGSISRSRLGRRVRFEGGLAYIVEANHIERGSQSVMMGYVGAAPKDARLVASLIQEEWQRLGQEGVTHSELQSAINYLSGSAALLGDDSMRLAEQMQRARRLGLGTDFATEWPARFEEVGLEDVNKAIQTLKAPGSLKILILGSVDQP